MIIVKEPPNSPNTLFTEMLAIEQQFKMQGGERVKWPTIKINPKTTGGKPIEVHYRPSVGIVYYASVRKGFCPRELMEEMKKRLDAATVESEIIVSATPTSVTTTDTPRTRAMLLSELYYSVSSIASFTWLFVPISVAITVSNRSVVGMPEVNALVASIFFDCFDTSKFSHLECTHHVKLGDFHVYDKVNSVKFFAAAFLIENDTISLVGDGSKLKNKYKSELPDHCVVDAPVDIDKYTCLHCGAPLNGESVMLDDKFMCALCWSHENTAALRREFIVGKVVPPYRQDEIARSLERYARISHVVGKRCKRLSARGIFYTDDTLLVSEYYGSYPLLTDNITYEYVLGRGQINVIEMARIVEALSNSGAPSNSVFK